MSVVVHLPLRGQPAGASARFDAARRAMLAAWADVLRDLPLPPSLIEEEATATASAMRQLVELGR